MDKAGIGGLIFVTVLLKVMRTIYLLVVCAFLFVSCASQEKQEEYKKGLGGDSVMNYKDNTAPLPAASDTVPTYSFPDSSRK